MPAPQPVGRGQSVIQLGGFGSPGGGPSDAQACVQLDLTPSRPRRGLGSWQSFLWAAAAAAAIRTRCSAICSEPGDASASSALFRQRDLPQGHAEMPSAWLLCLELGDGAALGRTFKSGPLCPHPPHCWVSAGSLQAECPQHQHPGSGGLSTPSKGTECLAAAF